MAEHHSLTVSKKGLKQLVKHEISSAAYYRKFLSHPVWPGGRSGITIGIGYDLGQNNEQRIRKDWIIREFYVHQERLVIVSGLKEDAAK